MWGVTPSDLWDWEALKQKIAKHGVRNSLLLAPMPTASTAQILGNNESVEAYTTNIYTRRVLSGEFQVTKKRTSKVMKTFECKSTPLSTDCEPSLAQGSHRP